MERVQLSKRLRFEILKRDGFRCRYCGINAASALLHVDHVIAVADGGTNDPENLVAACSECNLGKSDVSLDESRLSAPSPTEAMLDHAEQMREYLAAVKARDAARTKLIDAVILRWMALIDPQGMQRMIIDSLGYWINQIGLERVFDAVDATAQRGLSYESAQRKYFIAVMRNMRDGTTPRRGAQ